MYHYTDNLILYYLALFIISSRLGYIFTVTYISFILSTALSSMQSFKNTKWNKMNKTCVCVSMATIINVLNYMEKGDLAFIIPWSFWRKSKWEAYSRTYIRVLGNWFIPKISFIILFIKNLPIIQWTLQNDTLCPWWFYMVNLHFPPAATEHFWWKGNEVYKNCLEKITEDTCNFRLKWDIFLSHSLSMH